MKYRLDWQTNNMKVLKNKTIVRLVKAISLITLIFGIVAVGHIYVTISELKLKLEETKIVLSSKIGISSNLEENSKINRRTLETYLKFSTGPSQIEDFSSENNIIITEDLELPQLEKNSCKRLRCIQIRKNFVEIPSNIWKALLGTEDFRFLDHAGIDPMAIGRAIIVDIIAMKFIQGGSTLTQQLVKNLFLTNEKKLSRKIKEIIYAIYIENILEKEEILALYLNEVFWGTHNGLYLKGFYAASMAYFNKVPKDLSEFEATILVSFLKGPNYYSLLKDHKRIRSRSEAVFKRLKEINLFTTTSNMTWDDNKWLEFEKDYKIRSQKNEFMIYYLSSVNGEEGLDSFEKMVFYKSVLSKKEELNKRFKDVDFGVKALILDLNCEGYDCKKAFSFYSKFERNKRDAITKEYHQVGSLLKPIVYDTFIKKGRSYDELVSTAPITLKLKSGDWTPKDYSKAREKEMPLKIAMQKSKNIPLIRIASEVGFENLEADLSEYMPRLQLPLGEYPAQLLGALELSLEEVVVSYKKFIKSKCVQITNQEIKFETSILKYMSAAEETTISKLARNPLKSSLIFGKTGTSNNGLDNWYFAFDGAQVYILWFGVETDRNDKNLRISGATTAFMAFQDFINFRGKQVSEVICKEERI